MAREYTISGDNITVSGSPIIVWFNPNAAPSATFEVIRAWASQRANATSAQQGIQFGTKVTAFPTVVSATPSLTKLTDPASKLVGGTTGAAGTCGINASANGAGAETVIYSDNFNVLNGWLWVATPAETVVLGAGSASGFYLKFTSTPGTLTAWSFGIAYRELG
jgi:hypothetical protein